MAEDRKTGSSGEPGGDRRLSTRRRADRRSDERRARPPAWRRPWALVLYGVLGTLLVVVMFNRSRPAGIAASGPAEEEITTAAPGAPMAGRNAGDTWDGIPADARRAADHEQLMADGEAARGRRVRTELFCSSISQIALRSVEQVEPSVAELADTGGRVPAAECKWGPAIGPDPRPDVVLLVPPELAGAFSAAPAVDDGFVRRRRIDGVAEWVGRSDALALRTALVLREYAPPAQP